MTVRCYGGYADGLRIVDPVDEHVVRTLADCRIESLAVVPAAETPAETGDAPAAAGDEPVGAGREPAPATGDPWVFAGTFESGLFRSVDGGETFERIAAATLGPGGSGPDAVTAVATSPHDAAVVWVGTEPSRVYRSTDGAETVSRIQGVTDVPSASEWSFPPRPDTHHVRCLAASPADPDRWIVGIEAGALLVTPDGGDTWVDRPPGSRRDTHTLATHPAAPSRVYAAAGDGFAESDDGGQSWTVVTRGLDHGYLWGLAVDPGDPETALVSAATGANAAHRRGDSVLYRRVSRDDPLPGAPTERAAGPRFERLTGTGIPTGSGTYRAVLASGVSSGSIWALTNQGLYHTADGGDSFVRIDVSLPAEPAQALAVG